LMAFAIGWFAPQYGGTLEQLGLIKWMVITIFLVNGYQTHLHQMSGLQGMLITALLAVLINLLISPFIGLALVSSQVLPPGAALGLIVMATVPATLSSGIVMTVIAGGDGFKALVLTVLLNLLGVFTIPFLLQLTLEHIGILSLSPWSLLRQLILIVLLPFIIGMTSKRMIRIPPRHIVLRYLPSTCVIATVWMSVSASGETLKELNPSLLALIALNAACLHAVLILLCWLSRLLYRPQREEWLALLFTASQKTLPVAVGALTLLHQPAGLALVACILFHFIQLFADSLLASRLARRSRLTCTVG
jgi:solute carrier family 10 (sodium/bile acid cotransporter), member 7